MSLLNPVNQPSAAFSSCRPSPMDNPCSSLNQGNKNPDQYKMPDNPRFLGIAGTNTADVGARTLAESDYCRIIRALAGCSGRLLSNPSVPLNSSICCFETVMGSFMMSHRTPSVQGGVVREPL